MSRISLMTGIGLVALCSLAPVARPDDKAGPRSVEGAWKQVGAKNGEAQDYQKPPEGVEMIDCIVGGRFIWTVVKDGKVYGIAGGRYKFDKDKLSEIIEYVSGDGVPESFTGSTFEFTVTVDGETMTKVGTIQVGGKDYKINEKWARCH